MDTVDIVWFWNDRCVMRVPVRILGLIFLLWGTALGQVPEGRLSVPRGAVIRIEANGFDPPGCNAADRDAAPPTVRQIRWRFRTSTLEEYSEAKRLDYSQHRECWTQGTIAVRGKSYPWEVRWPDILFTSYPDGKDKMLQSGREGVYPPSPTSSVRPKVVRHPLPADARIVLGKSTTQDKEVDCSDFRLGAWGVRNRFRTYHLLGDGDMHDLYGYYPCRFDGSVIVHGRTYRFEAWSGNLLFTDFPDGEGKMLGGVPSDPPDGSDRGPVDADVLVGTKRK